MIYIYVYSAPAVLLFLLVAGVRSWRKGRRPYAALIPIALLCGMTWFFLVGLGCSDAVNPNPECTTEKGFMGPLLSGYLAFVLGTGVLALVMGHGPDRGRLLTLSYWCAVATPLLFIAWELIDNAVRF